MFERLKKWICLVVAVGGVCSIPAWAVAGEKLGETSRARAQDHADFAKGKGRSIHLFSPDSGIEVSIGRPDQNDVALVVRRGALRVNIRAGLHPDTGATGSDAIRMGQWRTEDIDRTWKPVWGQFSIVRDCCRQLTLPLQVEAFRYELVVRVYDSGIAYRFILPAQTSDPPAAVVFETRLGLPPEALLYFPKGENEPKGPCSLNDLDELGVPLVADVGGKGCLAVLESDLYTARGFTSLRLRQAPEENTVLSLSRAPVGREGLVTPWRVVLMGDNPGDLLTSTVPLNLSPDGPSRDVSWVKPGKSLWDWRVHGYRAGDFTYGVNTASYKRFIDFAAEGGIQYFLIDDLWFESCRDGKLVVSKGLDLEEVMRYARQKQVGIWLYYDRRKGHGMSDAALLKLYADYGAVGIKYGFMGDNAEFTRAVLELGFQNHLMVDLHDGPCPMTGVERVLPNAVTREYNHSQQDARRSFTPRTFLKQAMINALTGPLDMDNGSYALDELNQGKRQKGPKNGYNSTVVAENARVLIIHSGFICLPDAPEEYRRKADLFEFLRRMPVTWDETRILNSRLPVSITTARRSGRSWFIGSAIDEKGGTLMIPLDFLEEGTTYDVTFYEDTPETHYLRNREAYRVRTGSVKKGDVIQAVLAPGGGHCMWIRPAKEDA